MSKEEEIKKFIGEKVVYDDSGGFIFGNHLIAEIRGYGEVQNMFKDTVEAIDFHDQIGKFITEAINEKLALSTYKSSLIERLEEEVNSGEYNPESNSEANYALGLKKAIELIKQQ